MNYIEALQALVDGKRVKEDCWDGSDYMYLKNGEILTAYGNRMTISISYEDDITNDRYEVYQTEEEKLITDGKRFSVFRKCKGHSCQRCSAMNPCLYKTCEELGFKHLLLGIIADDDVTDADIDKLYNAVKGEIDA